ncbi:hypothetical protein DsansV1_C21g0165851 [Dioscorea sansibarensis]
MASAVNSEKIDVFIGKRRYKKLLLLPTVIDICIFSQRTLNLSHTSLFQNNTK